MQYYYFAPVPADLLENDKPNKTTMFLLISSLCRKTGKCTYSNMFLASKLKCSEKTIKRLIKKLVKLEYIESVVKNRTDRTITINEKVIHKRVNPVQKEGQICPERRVKSDPLVYNNSIYNSNDFNKIKKEDGYKYLPPLKKVINGNLINV